MEAKEEKKHFVKVEFYGKVFQIGIMAQNRSEAIVEALAKARSKIRIANKDLDGKIDEIETVIGNASTLINWHDRVEQDAKDIFERMQNIKGANMKDPDVQENIRKDILKLSGFLQMIYDAYEMSNLMDNREPLI